LSKHVQHHALDADRFDLDVQKRGIADQREDFGECRHALAVDRIERLDPRQRDIVDIAGAIGRSPEVSIMNDHRDAVGRCVDVELDAVDADSERLPECAERVLGMNRRRSAVGIDTRHRTSLSPVWCRHIDSDAIREQPREDTPCIHHLAGNPLINGLSPTLTRIVSMFIMPPA